MKIARRWNGLFIASLGSVLSLTGCTTPNRDCAIWLSSGDVDACVALARSSAAKDFAAIPLATAQPAIIRVGNWRECSCTVFLPMAISSAAPNEKLFLSFSFSNSVPYQGTADAYAFAERHTGNMVLTEEKILPLNPAALRSVGHIRE